MKGQQMDLVIKLPTITCVPDYHEFDELQSQLNNLLGPRNPKVKVTELGYSEDFGYVGIIYIGRRASKAVVAKLLKAEGIFLNDEE